MTKQKEQIHKQYSALITVAVGGYSIRGEVGDMHVVKDLASLIAWIKTNLRQPL